MKNLFAYYDNNQGGTMIFSAWAEKLTDADVLYNEYHKTKVEKQAHIGARQLTHFKSKEQ